MPQFTVHDITHIDALWEMADIILPEELEINPVEAFVLDGAFLIHDLGMGGIAYNNGFDKIKNSELWRDTHAILCKKYGADTERIENETFESVIRYFHAQQAVKLPLSSCSDKAVDYRKSQKQRGGPRGYVLHFDKDKYIDPQ